MKTKKDTANPLFRALFVGMTMKAWLNYAIRKTREWEAMQDITDELLFSDSDDEDYEIEYSDDEEGNEEEGDYYEDGEYEDGEGDDEEREPLDEVKEEDEEDEELLDSKEEVDPKDLHNRQLVYSGSKMVDPMGMTDAFKKMGNNANNNQFLDDLDNQAKPSSKAISNVLGDDEDRPSSVINYNINNNFIINNNYFIHPDNPEPIRQTNVILERNITVNAQPQSGSMRQITSQNSKNMSDKALPNGNNTNNKEDGTK